jgi:branched-chain amino acid transport system substrate-binding protein
MISSVDATGEDMERQSDAALQLPENKSVELVDREHFNTLDFSVAAQIARIKGARPQAVLVWTSGTPLGTVLRDVQSAGLDLPLLTSNGNMTYAQMNAYANLLPKEFFFPALLSMTAEDTPKGPLHDAQVAYAEAFKAIGVHPDEGHVLVWDPAMILISALRHIGPDATATQVRDYVLHLHGWVGVDGVYDFSGGDQRGIGDNAVAIARWDQTKNTWVRASRPRGIFP